MTASKSADFIVIGSGVTGASIAFHLMKRKAGRVLVLDRNLAAQGGSSRSSALVRMHYTLPEEVQLAVRSYEIFANWQDYVGRPPHFVPLVLENLDERFSYRSGKRLAKIVTRPRSRRASKKSRSTP